jgi:hypothetical protein
MSLKLLALIAGIIALVVPAIPSWVGQVRVEAFGDRVRTACARRLAAIENAVPRAISTLFAFALIFFFSNVGVPLPLPAGKGILHEAKNAFLEGLVIPVALVALALALGVILGIICILAPIVAKIPTGPRAFVTAGVLFGVASLVITYEIT